MTVYGSGRDIQTLSVIQLILTEVWVLHGLSCCQPLLVVIAQQLVQ